jgi:transcriptional regulator with XRE-family HTH domain
MSHGERKNKAAVQEEKELDRMIGHKLLYAREKYGLTRDEVSEALGISHQQLSKYENGHNRICVSKIIMLCNKFKISLDVFLHDMIHFVNLLKVDGQNKEVEKLIHNYLAIKSLKQRKAVQIMIESLL